MLPDKVFLPRGPFSFSKEKFDGKSVCGQPWPAPGKVYNTLAHLVAPVRAGFFPWDPPLALEGRESGCICIATQEGMPLIVSLVGGVAKEKLGEYCYSTQEKAVRLGANKNDFLSWQTRNPARDQWAGAVRSERFIYSFSGLPEMYNEALMLVVAHELSDMDPCEAWRLARISGNPHWAQLADRFCISE